MVVGTTGRRIGIAVVVVDDVDKGDGGGGLTGKDGERERDGDGDGFTNDEVVEESMRRLISCSIFFSPKIL